MNEYISKNMKMDFHEIASKTSVASDRQYWKAIDVWLNNPHLVNRRISSSSNLLSASIDCEASAKLIDRLSSIKSPSEFLDRLSSGVCAQEALNINDEFDLIVEKIDTLETIDNKTYLFVNKLLPRDTDKCSAGIEFIVVEKKSKNILCLHQNVNEDQRCLGLKRPYEISYHDNIFKISVEKIDEDFENPSIRWLREHLFPRLLKWIEADHSNDVTLIDGSLNLVSSEKYSLLYDKLKRKYGLEMVKKWPECTDPNKFVYEDVAIATYLLLIWEKDREELGNNEKKQSFVDLGCGNGLLVYILTSEGHSGTGIDLRKRKIWDIYPSTTRLEERTIVPSSSTLFPDVDWLIGNHSDELTPWIPVIAARSSYHCRFFLLPCCAHEFDGRKFQRKSAAKSQYFEYIKYVKIVSEGCGFKTQLDKLRIPSTKRICLIGGERNYPEKNGNQQDEIVEKLINERSLKGNETANNNLLDSQWSRDFKPRDSVERVRNCTQIDRTIIDEIINIVTSYLLRKIRVVTRKEEPNKTWNAGGQIELAEIAKIVPPETLKQLKKECGGLQTLLKNNSHIFQVLSGKVQFRVPGAVNIANKRKNKDKIKLFTMKIKPCWFYTNHPDGCPVSNEICTFKH